MSLTPQDIARRRRAKRSNEQVKLLATFLNNLAVGTSVGAILVPLASERPVSPHIFAIWIPVALLLHVAAQVACAFLLRSED
ncbi:hypothetical protein [Lichenibacterium dinghuense]|uniref:hypothetical protein n=1 Tax=Lichenibacterium dinghuense TaxID=2895977 RepID=UPI001F34A2D2|nr:hypothetical protein [Lichenibacterium sp. 6Y81]